MKVKILETFDSVTPQYFYFNGDNIIGLNIQNRYKYNIYYSAIRGILPIFQEPPAPPGISLSPIFAATWEGSAKKVGITWDVQDMIGLTWTVPMIWINYQEPFSINQGYGGPATVPIETPAAIIQKISEIEGVLGRSLTNRIVLHPGRYNFFDAWFGATGDNIPAGISYTAPTEVYVTPWGDRGVDGVSAEWNAWLTAYQGMSGPLNYLVLDKEGIGQPEYFTLFGITGNGKTPTKYLAALTGDARFNQSWRGATALSTLLSGVTLSLLLLDYQDSRCNFEYIKWWMYTRYYGIYGINKALWDNTKRLYPDAKGSNFESVLMTDRPAPNLNGHPLSDIGLFGSAAAPSAYGRNTGASAAWWIDQENPSQLIYRNSRGSPPRDTNNVLYGNDYKLTRNVWSSFQLDNQLGRACRRTAPNVYLHPWIANYKFAHPVLDIPNHTTNFTHYWSDKKYYYENIRHYALLGAEVFLYFNSTTGNLASQRIADTKAVDVVLEEVNTILGGSKVTQTVTVDPIPFTNASAGFTHPSRIITTGAKTVNDSYVWRTTVAPGITLIKNQAGVDIPLGNNVGIWDITDTPTPPVYTIVDTAPTQPLRSPIIAATWEGVTRKTPGGTTWDLADLIGLTWTVPIIWVNYNQAFSINQGFGGLPSTTIETPAAIIQKISEVEALTGKSLTNRVVLQPGRYNFYDAWFGATADNIPKGICYTAPTEVYVTPWADVGVEGVSAEWGTWISDYKLQNGRLDYLTLDKEGIAVAGWWSIKGVTTSYGRTTARYIDALTSDTRFSLPWRGLTALNTLLAGVCLPVLDLRNERCADCNNEYLKWEEAMKYYGTETVNKGWWYPTKSVYPNVKGSNFDCSQMTDRPGPDLNGHPQPEITFVGTASSPASYGRNSGASSGWWVDQDNPTQLIWKNARGNPPKDVNGNVYTDDYRLTRNVWSSLLLDQQLARGIRRSRPDVNLHSWIASYLFSEAGTQYFKDTRYYYENMRHYALLGTEIFLYWNSVGGNLASNRIAVTRAVDSVLDDINSKLGGSKVVETVTLDPIQFTSASSSYYDSSRILTTGARTIDGTYVWRTTFGPGVTRIKNNTTGIVSDLGNEVGIWNTTTVPVPPSYSIMTPNIFAFYDGSTGVYENYTWVGPGTGRYADARVDAAGGEYMYYVQLTDAGYAVGFNQAGWTSGTPYDWFTGQEVEGMVKTLVLQGATFTTKGYAYVNWTEDDREFFLLNGHTGPGTTMGCCFRTAADHDKLQKSVAKYFAGGTSSKDGLFYNGLRHYFPGISFGVYNLPPWYWSDNMWVKSTQEINDALEHAANVIAGCTALMDAIQLLMPSCYSVVSSKEMVRVRNWQAMRLCNSINNKLITNGKQPKQIVPFVQPFYETIATGNPYNFTTIYTTPTNSWSRNVLGLTLIQFRHTPPFTRKLENDLLYEAYEPIIYNGGNAMTIWLNPAYRMKTIAGRTLSSIPGTEDEVVSSPYINAQGRLDWNNGWRKGVTGATAVWSDKDMRRQSIAADWTYQAGICLGITGNRWWWRNNQTISGPYGVCGPAEWFPLSGREGVTTGNQPISAAGMSTKDTRDKIDRYLMDNIINNVTTFKNGWLNINKNGLIPPS